MATDKKQIAAYANAEDIERIEQLKRWMNWQGTDSRFLLAIIAYAHGKMSEEQTADEALVRLMFQIVRGEITEEQAIASLYNK